MEGFQSFIGIDFWTALFTLLNFLAVLYVGKRFLWGPVMKIIQDRQKEIDNMYSEADTARSSAMAMEAEYKEKLTVAVETGERIVKDATVRGQAREEEILRQANEEADAIRRKAQDDIARDKKKAVDEAKSEIAGLALDIAGKVVGQSMDTQAHTKLVDQFIDQLGEGV